MAQLPEKPVPGIDALGRSTKWPIGPNKVPSSSLRMRLSRPPFPYLLDMLRRNLLDVMRFLHMLIRFGDDRIKRGRAGLERAVISNVLALECRRVFHLL